MSCVEVVGIEKIVVIDKAAKSVNFVPNPNFKLPLFVNVTSTRNIIMERQSKIPELCGGW